MKIHQHNNKIDCLKGLAMVSVICAHCSSLSESAPVAVQFQSSLIHNLGTCGVIILFIVSGYLYHGTEVRYAVRKTINLLPAWLISGTCIYLYVYIRKPPLTFEGYIYFLLGAGSYLYYLPMLIIFYFLFSWSFMQRKSILLIMIAIGLAYTVLPASIKPSNFSLYLLPIHWIQYFALGLLMQKLPRTLKMFSVLRKKYICILCTCIYVTLIIICSANNDAILYWGGYYTIISLIGALNLLCITEHLTKNVQLFFQELGHNSLFIYLWHMPVAGITANLMKKRPMQYLFLITPILVVLIIHLIIHISYKILIKNKRLKHIFKCIGFRA